MMIPLEYQATQGRPTAAPSKRGKGFLAVAGTLMLPGLGHLSAGRWRRAAGWFTAALVISALSVVALLTPALQPALLGILPAALLLQIACLIDAYRTGRHSPRPMLGSPLWRYAAGIGLILLSVLVHPAPLLVRALLTPRVEAFMMPSKAMEPTLNPGDRFLVLKTPGQVRRWDLIVFHPPGNGQFGPDPRSLWVMRLVGLPGEKIEIVAGRVRVNDRPVDPPEPIRPYVAPPYFGSNGQPANGVEGNPIVLGPDEYFVLGDDSPISDDSRIWTYAAPGHQPGALPARSIVGRVTALYWPPSRWRRFR